MKKYIIAGTLVLAFAESAFAAGTAEYYVVLKLGHGAAACEVTAAEPDAKTHKMMGKYKSEVEAKVAMATIRECSGFRCCEIQ